MRVEARGLSRRFGSTWALRDVDFEIAPGARVALVGPNGSGKSTLNRILMGLLRYEGTVRVGGRAPEDDRLEIARHIAYVPQIAPEIAAPVAEVVRNLAATRGRGPEGVEKSAARLELDLASVGRRSFRDLSGGMKQKLLIALALAAEPSLLILDEPTGSLDPAARERFFSLLEDVPTDTTLLLCSHRIEELRQLVDHVLVLAEGRLAWDGGTADFLDSSSHCLLEVRIPDRAAADWLAAHGFRPGVAGWWMRTATHGEKLTLLDEVLGRFGRSLEDLNIRDFESLHLEGERE